MKLWEDKRVCAFAFTSVILNTVQSHTPGSELHRTSWVPARICLCLQGVHLPFLWPREYNRHLEGDLLAFDPVFFFAIFTHNLSPPKFLKRYKITLVNPPYLDCCVHKHTPMEIQTFTQGIEPGYAFLPAPTPHLFHSSALKMIKATIVVSL